MGKLWVGVLLLTPILLLTACSKTTNSVEGLHITPNNVVSNNVTTLTGKSPPSERQVVGKVGDTILYTKRELPPTELRQYQVAVESAVFLQNIADRPPEYLNKLMPPEKQKQLVEEFQGEAERYFTGKPLAWLRDKIQRNASIQGGLVSGGIKEAYLISITPSTDNAVDVHFISQDWSQWGEAKDNMAIGWTDHHMFLLTNNALVCRDFSLDNDMDGKPITKPY